MSPWSGADMSWCPQSATTGRLQGQRDKIDHWLRALLTDGPVARDRILERARREAYAVQRDPAQADLAGARKRLEVIPVYRTGDDTKTSWWALSGYDQARWEPIDQGGRLPASVIQG